MVLTLNVLFNYSFLDICTLPYVYLAVPRKKNSSSNSTGRASIFTPNFGDSNIRTCEKLSLRNSHQYVLLVIFQLQ